MKARVRLNLFGQVYELEADDPEVDVREVAAYVQQRIDEQAGTTSGLPPHKLMVLALLNIGKDCVLARLRLKALEDSFATKASRLSARIDSVMDCGT